MNDFEKIADDLIASQPDVQPAAVATEAAKESERRETFAQIKDRHGNTFDPEKHMTNSDGSPKTSSNGFAQLKRGRAKGSGAMGGSGGSKVNAGSGGVKGSRVGLVQGEAECRLAARQSVDAMLGLCQMIGGDEWAPAFDPERGLDERGALHDVWGRFFVEQGMADIPPGVAVAIASCAYVLPRLFMPKTKSRLATMKSWIVAKYVGLRYGTYIDSGDDGKRKDDAGKKASG